jgi:hypothetical protein
MAGTFPCDAQLEECAEMGSIQRERRKVQEDDLSYFNFCMHINSFQVSNSYVATRLSIAELQEAVLSCWPHLTLVESATGVATPEDAWAWAEPRCEHHKGTCRTDDVVLIYRDGDWSVLIDFSKSMMYEKDSLIALSRTAGRVITAVTQRTAGIADLRVYDSGALTRQILAEEGVMTLSGTALPEEAGLDLGHFYFDEIEAVWQNFGLHSFLDVPIFQGCVAMLLRDTKEFEAAQEYEQRKQQVKRRPWWRFW